MSDSLSFDQYIRIIGRGQRAGRSLTQQEAYQSMSMVLRGEVTGEQRGAYLMLLRVREETPEELAGFVQAARELTQLEPLSVDLDIGHYAGKRRHLPWHLLASILLSQSGRKIFLHGTEEPHSNRLYPSAVLPALGLPIAQTMAQAKQQLSDFNLCYMPLSTINPALYEIIQLRAQLGLRSCANTIARMLNPSQANASVQGVFHREVDAKHGHCATILNGEDIVCFRGEGGEAEYNPERDVVLHRVNAGQYSTESVDAVMTGRVIKSPTLNVADLIACWQGEFHDEYAQNAIIGSCALSLMVMDKIEWSLAWQQAESLWQSRQKNWPFARQPDVDDPQFSTLRRKPAH